MLEARESLGDIVPANLLDGVIAAITDCLGKYELSLIKTEQYDIDFLLESYLDAISVEGKSPKTIDRYGYILRRFTKTIGASSGCITTAHIRKYLSDEKKRGIADGTLKGIREIFSAYFGWLVREKLIPDNPMANIGAVKCQKKLRDAFSDVDIERMKIACSSKKQKALICFLLATGCRVSEATGLNIADVNLSAAECIVLGKGNKQRKVYMDAVAVMAVTEYLEERKDDNPALFLNHLNERLTPNGVRSILKQIETKSGVKNVHPHKFRRTCATNLIKHGMPIQGVSRILGHEKIDTTMRYVVLDEVSVEHDYRKYS